jgi:hypothetical protein
MQNREIIYSGQGISCTEEKDYFILSPEALSVIASLWMHNV